MMLQLKRVMQKLQFQMMKSKIFILFLIMGLVSCHPILKTEYIHHTDSIYIENTLYDSIYIKEYTKGDTVFVLKDNIKYQIQYRDRYKTDTVNKTDTIVKYINRTTKVRQKPFKAYLYGIITAVLLVIGFIVYVKIFQNRRIH